MTEKVVNAGIEDVLSSIKRLVSEEDRKIPNLLSSNSRKRSKLVLTDALRVGEAAKDLSQPVKEETVYKAEDSVKPMVLRACDIVQHSEPAAEQKKPEPEEGLAGSLSAKIEALEAAIARTEDQWEPDGDSDDAYAGTPNRILAWTSEQEFDLVDTNSENDDPVVETKVAKQETKQTGQTEPVTTATFIRDPAVSAKEIPDQIEVQALTDAPAMDKEALRELIAQVVREELQGVLGERITRNVRKMVRREIYRALAEQKLE
ncbi:hypothetical protein [Ruegeria lacuscaerulensis]|uniref:hypothetical protein n=1 Tax=Ruegeria lacuscaerulensis TaxID=55218 RepID=UPI00147ABFE4|nr:hypothetical protein [Ruegeria lacuscaerulensis]